MKPRILSLLALALTAAAAFAQTTTLTINSSTGLINVPAGVTPNFSALRIGGTTIGSLYQPLDADLTTFAGITPSSNVQSLLGAANYAAIKTLLGLNNVENTALSTWAGSTALTTLGTVATGTWNATAIAVAKGGVPSGGTTGQVLTKSSGTSYDVAWETPSGGSAPADPNVAYVRTGGNDTTGTIGNPALPYATAQAALDDGATVLDLGVGSFGDITLPAGSYFVRGRGGAYGTTPATTLGEVTTAGNVTLCDTGVHSVKFADLLPAAATTLTINGVRCDNIFGDGAGPDAAANINVRLGSGVEGDIYATSEDGVGGTVVISANSEVFSGIFVGSTGVGSPGQILIYDSTVGGPLSPDAATVGNARISTTHYGDSYP